MKNNDGLTWHGTQRSNAERKVGENVSESRGTWRVDFGKCSLLLVSLFS